MAAHHEARCWSDGLGEVFYLHLHHQTATQNTYLYPRKFIRPRILEDGGV